MSHGSKRYSPIVLDKLFPFVDSTNDVCITRDRLVPQIHSRFDGTLTYYIFSAAAAAAPNAE